MHPPTSRWKYEPIRALHVIGRFLRVFFGHASHVLVWCLTNSFRVIHCPLLVTGLSRICTSSILEQCYCYHTPNPYVGEIAI